jgi:hypothetical protein
MPSSLLTVTQGKNALENAAITAVGGLPNSPDFRPEHAVDLALAKVIDALGVTPVLPPSGLGWIPNIPIYKRFGGYSTAFDVATLWPAGGTTYYVDYPGHADGNDGLTKATSFTSIPHAIAVAVSGDTIQIAAGLKVRSNFGLVVAGKSLRFVGDGAGVILSPHDVLAWTLQSGTTYQAARSAVNSVWDSNIIDANGDYQKLTNVASIAAVNAQAGTWFTDGTTVYVRASDSRSLIGDTKVRAYLSVTHVSITGPATVFWDNISLEGDVLLVTNGGIAGNAPVFYARNGKAKYCGDDNAVRVEGCDTIFQNFEAAQAQLDGFNYHTMGGVLCRSIEINCKGRDNGTTGLSNNNGSTTHDGQTIVRLNGEYYRNEGPNVIDVNGARSWNLGCRAHDSLSIASGNRVNFWSDGEVWIDGGVSQNPGTYDQVVTATGKIHDRDLQRNGVDGIAVGGLIDTY